MFPQVTGADERWAARLQGFDPFLDDLQSALSIDDAQDIRELMKIASQERSVAFTFPSMPEIFHGTIMTRPGARNSGPPLVLVDVSAAGLDTTHWTKGIPVNFGFLDANEYIGCRTSFAGSVGQIMALLGPRLLHRFSPPGRARLLVPRDEQATARFELPGEGERLCRLREAGSASVRGIIEPGPVHRPGLALGIVFTLPDGTTLRGEGVVIRMRLREDQTRDVLLDIDAKSTEAAARLAACGQQVALRHAAAAPTPTPQSWSTP